MHIRELNYGLSRSEDWVTSLERIDPTKGYTKINTCLICAEFNGIDFTATAKYSNGGSGAWSKEKFNFFFSTVLSNTDHNLPLNYGGMLISLNKWLSLNNPLYIHKFDTTNFQVEIVDPVNDQHHLLI